MSLSQKSLSSIQKAGHATHSALQMISAEVQAKAQSMVASVATQPFGAESEQAFSRFKMLARLSQGLSDVEGKLRELYAIAMELASPASDVVIALPYGAKHEATNGTATDVVAKAPRAAQGAKKKAKAKKSGKATVAAGPLTANDTTLLQYLQGTLKTDETTRLTGGAMAAGSGLPLGSIGISLKKLLATGVVKSSARGEYQLGAASASQDAVPEVNSKPAKKAKAARTKKSKAVTPTADASPAVEAAAN